MNKFRTNLHPAFFYGETLNKAPEVDENYTEAINVLKNEISQEFKASTDNFLISINQNQESEITSRYTNTPESRNQLRQDHKRFRERMDKQNDGKKYSEIWNDNIEQGFGHLISALESNKYFKNDAEKTTKIKEIKGMYWNEVKKQYINNVWFARDKKFDEVKNNLFSRESEDYPANKIYKKLTGARTIFAEERTAFEGYDLSSLLGASVEDTQTENLEGWSEGKKRDFLSEDLPEALWDIHSTPGLLKVLNILPFLSIKEDKPSEADMDGISDFLKIASKIKVEGKDGAIILLEVFKDNRLKSNSTSTDYENILKEKGVDVSKLLKDVKIDNIVKAGAFYISTQRVNKKSEDQHAIYLSVLKIIETEGGVDNAIKKCKPIVDKVKATKKMERKEGYADGEKMSPEFKAFAEKLGITDFTNATRLSELAKNNPDYFAKNNIEDILANLNNDDIINTRDYVAGGQKTGSQFLEIFKQVGKEKALPSLLEHAKLINKAFNLGIDENKFTEEEIRGKNVELILLLQDIISKPGEDLYTLLSGHKENPFEGIDLAAEKNAADEYAKKMVEGMNMKALKDAGLQTPESMHSGLSGALFTEYKRGIGIGSKVSFNQWIKGVNLNTGVQVRNGGVVVGLGLDYSNKINLGKGWSTTPEVSTGAFIPLGYGKPELSGSVGFNDKIAKERITNNGIQESLGIRGGVTLLPAGFTIVSAGLSWERDKKAGIEVREQEMRGEMVEKMKGVLEKISTALGNNKFDLNVENVTYVVKKELREMAKGLGIKEKEINSVVDATTRLLLNYNNADLSNKDIRDVIAQRVADQYAMAWAEGRKANLAKKGAYLANAGLGVFWATGAPLVGVYAGIGWKNHKEDGHSTRWGNDQTIDNSEYDGELNERSITALNNRLGFPKGKGLEITSMGVKIPNSFMNRVKVGNDMQGLMVKDTDGNIYVSKRTSLRDSVYTGSGIHSKELYIGAGSDGYKHLDEVQNDPTWFKNNISEVDTGILEQSNLLIYTPDKIKEAINSLKKKSNGELNDFNPTEQEIAAVVAELKKLSNKSKKAKIVVERTSDGGFAMRVEQTQLEGKGLEVEYQAKFEMIDSRAKTIANEVYSQVLKLDANGVAVLNSVKHDIKNKQGKVIKSHRDIYDTFNKAILEGNKNGNYAAAKDAIKPIFERLIKDCKLNVNDNGFKKALEILDQMDGAALGQALMSIDNIFARSTRVLGKNEKYTFPTEGNEGMSRIIADREKQISRTIETKLQNDPDGSAKKAYLTLIEASKKERKQGTKFNIKEATAAQLPNTVGFNLGDKTNPERPLFNPEIYNPMVDFDEKDFENPELKNAWDLIHERAMRQFTTNPALINPILKGLGLPENAVVTVQEGSFRDGKITLDIGGKKVTLSAEMNFGYFTQCVNHTVILSNISAEGNGRTISFESRTWLDSNRNEGNQNLDISTTSTSVTVSGIVYNGSDSTDSGTATDDATQGGKQLKTGQEDTNETDKDPNIAGGGTTDDSGGNEV